MVAGWRGDCDGGGTAWQARSSAHRPARPAIAMPRVTSRHNERVREAMRLARSSRDRRKSGCCILEGEHLIRSYCDRVGSPESLIVVESAAHDADMRSLIDRVPDGRAIEVSAALFAEIAVLPPDVAALAVVRTPQPKLDADPAFAL